MKENIQSLRGMHDFLPEETSLLGNIEESFKNILSNYGYDEIRLPIIEQEILFRQAIGETSNIIKKEMYTFSDRNGKILALRPEGTSGCVRSGIKNRFIYGKENRLWYIGPMFRYERPQKGRYRQFHQIGIEIFGNNSINIEIELILLISRIWKTFGIENALRLEINSIGSDTSMYRYYEALVNFLNKIKSSLSKDCQNYIYTNPIRIFNTTDFNSKNLLSEAPTIYEYLDDQSRIRFSKFCDILNCIGISYKINPRLMRGINYYNDTVFEWTINSTNFYKTLCGGGRYDTLVEKMGGRSVPALGCAVGLERLVLLVKKINPNFMKFSKFIIFLITMKGIDKKETFSISEKLRNDFPSIKLIVNYKEVSIRRQFSYAYKIGATIAIVLGSNEIIKKTVTIKNLATGKQEVVQQNYLNEKIKSLLRNSFS